MHGFWQIMIGCAGCICCAYWLLQDTSRQTVCGEHGHLMFLAMQTTHALLQCVDSN